MATPEKDENEPLEETLLEQAKKRFRVAEQAEAEIRKLEREDRRFLAGDQWPDQIRLARDIDKRPCLTINRLPQIERQVTNEIRQNRPSIKVNPVDDDADKETALILQGLIRHIEYASNADVAYDTAAESAIGAGLGYFRIITDYCDPESFDQDILIKRVRDRMSVYLDPHSQEPDGSDSNWGFVFNDMSKDEFKANFPKAELSGESDWSVLGERADEWIKADSVRVAEYFYKTFEEAEVVLLSDKSSHLRSELPKKLPEGIAEVDSRKTLLPKIKWCKLNGVEILEETDWPGQWIPIIPVIGAERMVDGKRILEGIVRHAKDPQRMYNYWASAETETIALAPRAPYIGMEGQFEGHEAAWTMANQRNLAYLEYKPKTLGGQPAPPPQRNVFEPPVQAITQARMQASEDMKATTGVYDAALGNRSNENSGVAIQRRNMQSQTSNFHFADNLSRAIRHAGRIIVDLIPHVYDAARTVRTIGEDGEVDLVKVNQLFDDGSGNQKGHYLNKGTYDVTVSTGPSYQTKRQEAAEAMLDFMKVIPPSAPLIADLVARNMDWPGSEQLAERLKKTLPPNVAEPDDKDKNPLPPAAAQHMQQQSQMIGQLTQQLHAAHDVMDQKKMELDSKERIEFAKIEAQLRITEAQINQANAQAVLENEVAHIHKRLDVLMTGAQIEHEQMTAAAAQDAQSGGNQNQQPTGGPSPGQSME